MIRHYITLVVIIFATLLAMIFLPSFFASNDNDTSRSSGRNFSRKNDDPYAGIPVVAYEDAVGSALSSQTVTLAQMRTMLADAVSNTATDIASIATIPPPSSESASSTVLPPLRGATQMPSTQTKPQNVRPQTNISAAREVSKSVTTTAGDFITFGDLPDSDARDNVKPESKVSRTTTSTSREN